MIFTTPTALFIFLPLAIVLYNFARKDFRQNIIIGISIFFYAWVEPNAVLFVLILIIVVYCFGFFINNTQPKYKNSILGLGIAIIVGILVIFKYSQFLIQQLILIAGLAGFEFPKFIVHYANTGGYYPLGLSFISFLLISYLIDVNKGTLTVETSVKNFFSNVLFFPKVIAGPITRYGNISSQTENIKPMLEEGAKRAIIGLAKKVLIANQLGRIVDQIFIISPDQLSPAIAWFGIISYAFQIFFDFSGYTDMAIGIGLIFGIRLPENFNFPYMSKSITEFWRRWHITLSNWFRDYVFYPLERNRARNSRIRLVQYINIFFVFLLTGIWHGAGWNFIVWGGLFGIAISIEQMASTQLKKLWDPVKRGYTLLFLLIAWIFFRSNTIDYALHYIRAMFNPGAVGTQYVLANELFLSPFYVGVLIIAIATAFPTGKLLSRFTSRINYAGLQIGSALFYFILLLVSIIFVYDSTFQGFIYTKF